MQLRYDPGKRIVFPEIPRQTVLDHCHRSLAAFQQGKTEDGKAFGLIFGTVHNAVIEVTICFELQRNVRSQAPYKEYMDQMMSEHAVVSQTPLEKRGWVADPAELFARIKQCRQNGDKLIGTYHMHRVAWEHDPVRDTPTQLDGVLAEKSGLLMFIVSMVTPEQPIIRAFYEGKKEREIVIR